MKAKKFEQQFDEGVDITASLDLSKTKRELQEQKRVTRDFKETVIQHVQNDASFAKALLDEAATLFLNGEPETARLILRDLVNATIGFEKLATMTAKPSKSMHRMLSPTGNPSMDNLAAIFRAVREQLQVSLSAHSVAA